MQLCSSIVYYSLLQFLCVKWRAVDSLGPSRMPLVVRGTLCSYIVYYRLLQFSCVKWRALGSLGPSRMPLVVRGTLILV